MSADHLLAIFLVTTVPNEGSNVVFRYPPHPHVSPRLSRPAYGESLGRFNADGRAGGVGGRGKVRATPVETGLSQAAGWTPHRARRDDEDDDAESNDDLYWRPLDVADHNPRTDDEAGAGPGGGSRFRPTGRQAPPGDDEDAFSALRKSQSAAGSSGGGVAGKSGLGMGTGFIMADYERCLGYPYGDLKQFLSAKREACHRRFELSIDELTFLGHPVCPRGGGTDWSLEVDQDEDEVSRGRGRRPGAPGPPSVKEDSHGSGNGNGSDVPPPSKKSSTESATSAGTAASTTPVPPLASFHLVLVIDKPDPLSFNSAPSVLYDTLYEELAFKWTAAAFAEQARTGWVARECQSLGQIREDAITRQIPLRQAQQEAFKISTLASSIRALYTGIKQRAAAQVMVGEIPVDFRLRLPDKPAAHLEEWTLWGEGVHVDVDASDEEGEWSDGAGRTGRQRARRRQATDGRAGAQLRPWKTLLRLSSDAQGGPAMPQTCWDAPELQESVDLLISALDPTETIADIAKHLSVQLQDLFPVADYLVAKGHVKVIDPIRPRLRSFLPNTTGDRSIPQIMANWAATFPHLPSFDAFMSQLSTTTLALHRQTPAEREAHEQALAWLLEHDLVIQIHTYIRVFASAKVKAIARQRHAEARLAKHAMGPKQRRRRESVLESPFGGGDAAPGSPDSEPDVNEDLEDSLIYEPGKAAHRSEGRWIEAMLEGKQADVAESFRCCLPYFNGRTTQEELLYKTGLKRPQVRRVLEAFGEHLLTFLHP